MRLKKIVACTVAATMVLGSLSLVAAQPFALVDTDAAEDSGESLSGTGWWGEDNGILEASISGDGSWTVTFNPVNFDPYGALTVEVYDPEADLWISTSSNLDGWGTGTYSTTSLGTLTWSTDSVYTVTVDIADGVYTIAYYQDDVQLNNIVVTDAELSSDSVIRARVHAGTFVTSIVENVTEDSSEDTSEDTSEDSSEESSEDTSEDTTEDASEDTSEDTSEDASEDTSEDTSEDASEDASEDTSEDATEDASEDASEDSSEAEIDYSTPVDTVEIADLTCGVFWTTFSNGLALVDGESLVIFGTTTSTGDYNWDNMIFALYSSDDGAVYGAGTDEATAANYVEYFVGRADNYGWGTAGYTVTSGAPEDEDESAAWWAEWLAATQAGQAFTITAVYVNGTIQITCECGDAVYVMTYAVTDTSLTYYVALTGEQCALTNVVANYYAAADDAIDEDAANAAESGSDDDSNGSTEGGDTEDNNSETTVDADSYTEIVDQIELADLSCDGFWGSFTQSLALVENESFVITGTTTNLGADNWCNMVFALFSSDDGNIYAADSEEGAAANYVEYFVGRVDNYGWGTATYEVVSAPDDWDAWLAETQAGLDFTITAVYVDGTIQITCACGDCVYVVTYEVEDPDLTYYIALTGQECELTNLVATWYTASAGDLNSDLTGTDDGSVSGDEGTGTTSSPQTGDVLPIVAVLVALCGCAIILVASKKRRA